MDPKLADFVQTSLRAPDMLQRPYELDARMKEGSPIWCGKISCNCYIFFPGGTIFIFILELIFAIIKFKKKNIN